MGRPRSVCIRKTCSTPQRRSSTVDREKGKERSSVMSRSTGPLTPASTPPLSPISNTGAERFLHTVVVVETGLSFHTPTVPSRPPYTGTRGEVGGGSGSVVRGPLCAPDLPYLPTGSPSPSPPSGERGWHTRARHEEPTCVSNPSGEGKWFRAPRYRGKTLSTYPRPESPGATHAPDTFPESTSPYLHWRSTLQRGAHSPQ